MPHRCQRYCEKKKQYRKGQIGPSLSRRRKKIQLNASIGKHKEHDDDGEDRRGETSRHRNKTSGTETQEPASFSHSGQGHDRKVHKDRRKAGKKISTDDRCQDARNHDGPRPCARVRSDHLRMDGTAGTYLPLHVLQGLCRYLEVNTETLVQSLLNYL